MQLTPCRGAPRFSGSGKPGETVEKSRSLAAALAAGWLLGACVSLPPPRPVQPVERRLHLSDDWFRYRAQGLGLSVAEAKARDAALSQREPPRQAWDTQLRAEAKALWVAFCASCHGLRGDLKGVPAQEPPPRAWNGIGPDLGFFFGGDRMRAGLYRKIRDGAKAGPDGTPSKMVAWGPLLSREQIWALVFHIEQL